LHWLGTEAHPLAGYFDEAAFDAMLVSTRGRCSWCDADIFFGDPGLTIYERDSMVLCAKCSGHDNPTDETPTRIYVPAGDFASLR
jgi:hypothetical protein